MKKSYRVKREIDFQTVFTKGISCANRKFVVYHQPNTVGHYRVGLSVGKKRGNAVKRNQIKRRLRHIILALGSALPAEDIVIIARQGVEQLDYDNLERNLKHVLRVAKLYQEEKQ